MRRTLIFNAVLCLPLLATDARLTPEEREKAIGAMKTSQQDYIEALNNVTEAQWKWKPTAERWSVGECAEHIVLAEALLFGKVQEAVNSPANPEWETKTKGKIEFLEKVMPNRLGKAKSPLEIEPKGNMSKEEALKLFRQGRVQTSAFIAETQVPLKEHTAEHPFPVFNTLSAYQWYMYIPWHTMRHLKQIAEVKATEGYPKD